MSERDLKYDRDSGDKLHQKWEKKLASEKRKNTMGGVGLTMRAKSQPNEGRQSHQQHISVKDTHHSDKTETWIK